MIKGGLADCLCVFMSVCIPLASTVLDISTWNLAWTLPGTLRVAWGRYGCILLLAQSAYLVIGIKKTQVSSLKPEGAKWPRMRDQAQSQRERILIKTCLILSLSLSFFTSLCLCLYFFLSIYLSLSLSVCLSVFLSVSLCLYLSLS